MASVRNKPASVHTDDGDDYWHSSGFKPFNFNEEEDEEDSIEIVRWDGSTAAPVKPKQKPVQQKATPARPPQPLRSASVAVSVSRPGSASARYQSARRPTPHFPPSPASLSSSATSAVDMTPSQSSIERESIAEVVSAHSTINVTSVAKLESEISSLHRQLKQAKKDSAAAPSREETLSRIMVGNTYMLELYKSKEEKASLLDGALKRHDGNAIVAITLFMRDTLKRDIFSKELMKRPVAVDHYCSYLREAEEIDELHETLSALGRTEEAAMLKYRQCLATTAASTPEIRANGLTDCIKYYFDSDVRLAHETSAISEQISMVERQSVVEDADSQAEKSGHVAVFKSHPRKEPIIHKSTIETLFYCCYYHWGEGEGLLSSPTAIRNKHRIGEKQFQYIAISALCRMRRWRDLETLLTTPKTLFRSARLQSALGFEKVVDVLSKNHAPPDALSKYCAEIDNTDRRLEMAMKHNCYKVAIDAFVTLRDRQRMMAYLDKIPVGNEYLRQHLMNQARSADIKWKN